MLNVKLKSSFTFLYKTFSPRRRFIISSDPNYITYLCRCFNFSLFLFGFDVKTQTLLDYTQYCLTNSQLVNTQLKMKTTKVCYAFSTACNLSKLNRRKTTRQKREHSSSSKTERSSFGFVPTQRLFKVPYFSYNRQYRALCVTGGHFGFKCTER